MATFEWARTAEQLDAMHLEHTGTLGYQVLEELREADQVLFNENDIVSSDPFDGIAQSGVYPVARSDNPHNLYVEALGFPVEQEFAKPTTRRSAAKVVEFVARAA